MKTINDLLNYIVNNTEQSPIKTERKNIAVYCIRTAVTDKLLMTGHFDHTKPFEIPKEVNEFGGLYINMEVRCEGYLPVRVDHFYLGTEVEPRTLNFIMEKDELYETEEV